MSRYFIDTSDGRVHSLDSEGEEFADVETARRCAMAYLPALADDALPDGDCRDFSVTLRGEGGVKLFVARVSYQGEWVGSAVDRRIA